MRVQNGQRCTPAKILAKGSRICRVSQVVGPWVEVEGVAGTNPRQTLQCVRESCLGSNGCVALQHNIACDVKYVRSRNKSRERQDKRQRQDGRPGKRYTYKKKQDKRSNVQIHIFVCFVNLKMVHNLAFLKLVHLLGVQNREDEVRRGVCLRQIHAFLAQ